MIRNAYDEMITIAAPVMGFDKQLGILILEYKVAKFHSIKDNK